MKRFLFIVLVLSMIAGFVMAEDTSIGLSPYLEFGVWNANKPNDAKDTEPYIMPGISYDKSFGALDLYTELDYYLGLNEPNGANNYYQELYFDLYLGYNLNLSEKSTLTFCLENENDVQFTPIDDGLSVADQHFGQIRPGVKFNQKVTDVGNFYAKVDLPIRYTQYWGATNYPVGLDFTAGMASNSGLGFKAKVYTLLVNDKYGDDVGYYKGFTGIDLTPSFEKGPLYAELNVRIAKQDDWESSLFDGSSHKSGVAIIPKFQYSFDMGLSAYVYCSFGNITGPGDVKISPAVGVSYSF